MALVAVTVVEPEFEAQALQELARELAQGLALRLALGLVQELAVEPKH